MYSVGTNVGAQKNCDTAIRTDVKVGNAGWEGLRSGWRLGTAAGSRGTRCGTVRGTAGGRAPGCPPPARASPTCHPSKRRAVPHVPRCYIYKIYIKYIINIFIYFIDIVYLLTIQFGWVQFLFCTFSPSSSFLPRFNEETDQMQLF